MDPIKSVAIQTLLAGYTFKSAVYTPLSAQTVVTASKLGSSPNYTIEVIVAINDSDKNTAYFTSASLSTGQYSVNVGPMVAGPLLPSSLSSLSLLSDLLYSHDSMYDNQGVFYVNTFVSSAIQGYFPTLKLASIGYGN